ncbi:ATP-binding cassette sub-family C member 9-like [Acanthaster planci]|uniref:ATP-binding cassette sub-family C member 9-like n=1 Tax=Acanthaster planci TaxID=133434 RepID=A0A8B7XL55_ACAPL|nr:ATP-binding cassette sub-family C member 9-like [Acanthaster planci]
MDPMWEWFCGKNNSYVLGSSPNVIEQGVNNTCFVDAVAIIPHAGFVVLASLILFGVSVCSSYRGYNTRYIIYMPGHTIRWIVSLLLLFVMMAAVGEGLLSDATYLALDLGTQPHLYAGAATAMLGAVVSLIYYHHMELWELPTMDFLLLIYWILGLLVELLRLLNLYQTGLFDVTVMRFDICMLIIISYAVFILCDLNLIRVRVFGLCRSGPDPFPKDLMNPDMEFMYYYVNFLSQQFFWWINWLMSLGYRRPLELEDLGDIPERHEANYNFLEFKKALKIELDKCAKNPGSIPSLWKLYFQVYGFKLFGAGVLKLAADFCGFVGPLVIAGLTKYVSTLAYGGNEKTAAPHLVTFDEFFDNGFVLVGTLFCAYCIKIVCGQGHMHRAILQSMNVRAALQGLVYQKALRLSTYATTGGMMTVGQITNHMSTDAMNVLFMFQTINYLWSIPMQVVVILILLYLQMGVSSLIGASVFLLVFPIQVKIATSISKAQKELLKNSDGRMKQVNELLQGIKLLKMYAWEDLYCKGVEVVREKELRSLLNASAGLVFTIFFTAGTPTVVTLVAFGIYTPLTGSILTPDVTFASLSLFNQLAVPLFLLPFTLFLLVNAVVSTRRLAEFLVAPEVEGIGEGTDEPEEGEECIENGETKKPLIESAQPAIFHQTSSADEADEEQDEKTGLLDDAKKPPKTDYGSSALRKALGLEKMEPLDPKVAIKISRGNFLWDPEGSQPCLSDIDVEIPKGKLTMVVGSVGSGKSSILAAMLGEMTTVSGQVQIGDNESIAYAGQKAWLLNATMRDNILFSETYNANRYKRVLDACALKPDIDILPAGDQTEIGEKGINLSGGQKQRVSVARTMYSHKSIVVLDDPLSALDVHVGRTLLEEGITKWLMGHKRTVILVTHQLQYLNRADLIIVMKDGRIAAQGDLDDIITADPDMYSEYDQAVKAVSDIESESESGTETQLEREALRRKSAQLIRRVSAQNLGAKPDRKFEGVDEKEAGKLIEQEEMERGSVSAKIYIYYFKNMGALLTLLTLLTVLGLSGLQIGTNFWLSDWSEAGLGNETESSDSYYLAGYAALSAASLIVRFISSGALIAASLVAAKAIHQEMLRNLIRAPLRFFDTTPIGRILNRFSNDTMNIDSKLAQSFNNAVGSFMNCFSAVIVNTIVMPYFILLFTPIAIAYYFLQSYFLTSSRELQRLDNTSRSPIFAYFSETLNGLTTVRAYKCQKRFFNSIIDRINKNQVAYLYLQTANRWLGVRLDFIGALIVLVAGMTTLVGALTLGLEPSLVGLGVTYSLQIAGFLNLLVRGVADTEMQMNSVERVAFYSNVESEQYEGRDPPEDWPRNGRIQFDRASVRYSADSDPVLRAVSVDVSPGEKVGICGRTGAGKSSLTLALLRVIDIFGGRILIDGIDIKSVPLQTLRSRVSIIPQDPVLFTGTIRGNLDPLHEKTDSQLWESLEIAQLKDVVAELDGGLDALVTEGGENFSVGQRQLFCLARAFLRKSRILIMDEATASIDLETDKLLQKVVVTAFADRTVLTIAHRIATILNSDKILVLNEGKVAEFDTPDNLMQTDGSLFASFVRDKDK